MCPIANSCDSHRCYTNTVGVYAGSWLQEKKIPCRLMEWHTRHYWARLSDGFYKLSYIPDTSACKAQCTHPSCYANLPYCYYCHYLLYKSTVLLLLSLSAIQIYRTVITVIICYTNLLYCYYCHYLCSSELLHRSTVLLLLSWPFSIRPRYSPPTLRVHL